MTTQDAPLDRAVDLLREHFVPWWRVPGDEALAEGVMRRCLVCGRTSKIVDDLIAITDVHHEADCAVVTILAALAPSLDTPAGWKFDPMTCPHEGEWLRNAGDWTWCADCGRWRDDIMREAGYPPPEPRDPAVQRLVEAARPLLEAIDAHDDANIHGWAAGVREALRHLEQEAGG